MNRALPFNARVRLPQGSDDYRLTLEVVGPADLDRLEPVERLLDCFEQLAAWGAFAILRATPMYAKFERVSSEINPGLRRVYQVRGIHLGAYRILLHALARCHHHQLPLVSIRLEAQDAAAEEVELGAILDAEYPPRGPIPYRLAPSIALDEAKDPVLRVEFAQALSDRDYGTLRQLFGAWDVLIAMGGWTIDTDPLADFHIEPSSTYMAGASTIEHVGYGLRLPPAAVFDAVINFTARASAAISRVVELSIE